MAKIEDKSECLTQSNFSIQELKLCIGVKVGRERRRNFLLSRGKAPSVGSWCEDCAGGAVRPRSSWVGCSRVRVNWRDGYDRFVRGELHYRTYGGAGRLERTGESATGFAADRREDL